MNALSERGTEGWSAAMRVFVFAAACLALQCPAFASEETAKRGFGLSYRHDVNREVPWSVHVLKVDRTDPGYELQTMLGGGPAIGLSTIGEQIKLIPADAGRPVAAINADYYEHDPPYAGDPKGLQIVRGELISAPSDWTCVWVDAAGEPQMGVVTPQFKAIWPNQQSAPIGLNEKRDDITAVLYTRAIGASTRTEGGREIVLEKAPDKEWRPLRIGEEYTLRVREVRETGNTTLTDDTFVLSLGSRMARRYPAVEPGALIRVSTATTPSLQGASAGIGGGPALVRDGQPQPQGSQIRHPRVAMGWNKDFICFVVVDGRKPGISMGMTYSEVASYLAKMGCQQALNLDGGGSSTLWIRGLVVNDPSEGEARGVANGLVIMQKRDK